MPYYNRDPKRHRYFDNHPHVGVGPKPSGQPMAHFGACAAGTNHSYQAAVLVVTRLHVLADTGLGITGFRARGFGFRLPCRSL